MSIDIKIENDDIVISQGKTQLTEGKEQIIQSLKNRLLTRKGEFFLNVEYGLDYTYVFSIEEKEPSEELKILGIKECILQDSRISNVDSVSISKDSRHTTCNFVCTLTTGEQIEGGVTVG